MRPSVGGAAAGNVGVAAVVVVDQLVIAGVGFSAGGAAATAGAPFLAARARMAVGTQRPMSLSPWPAGQGVDAG